MDARTHVGGDQVTGSGGLEGDSRGRLAKQLQSSALLFLLNRGAWGARDISPGTSTYPGSAYFVYGTLSGWLSQSRTSHDGN